MHPIVAAMLRKAAFLALVPVLLASADTTPPARPSYTVTSCPDTDLAKSMAPIRLLFSAHPEPRAVLVTADGCPAL